MENAYLSLSSKRGFKPGPILLIAVVIIATFVLMAGYLLVMASGELDLPSDPPPIIIKSGSFIMESEKVFQPDTADQRNYKNLQFNSIKGIRIITYNENAQAKTYDKKYFEGKDSTWENGDNVQVNIYVQICQQENPNGTCASWGGLKKVEVFSLNGNFEVNVPNELHISKSKKNKKNKRQFKNEDENPEIIRFYMMDIFNKTKNTPIDAFSAQEGQEYYIGFYNTLVSKTGETSAQ